MSALRLRTFPSALPTTAARALLRLLLVGGLLLLALTGASAVASSGSDAGRSVRASHASAPAVGVRTTTNTTSRATSAKRHAVPHTTSVGHTEAGLSAAQASTSGPARSGLPAGMLPSRRGPPAGTFLVPLVDAGVDVPRTLAPSPATARAPPSAA